MSGYSIPMPDVPRIPPTGPSATEVKRILRAVATIILAAFVEEEAVKPSKKASQKKKRAAKTKSKRKAAKKASKKKAKRK